MVNNFDLNKFKEELIKYEMNDWLEEWDMKNIYNEVSKLEPGQQYVEIGVARGISSTVACIAAKNDVKITGIDVINWADRDEKMLKILNTFGKKDLSMWTFLEGESQVMAKYWKGGMIDTLLIDGDHTSWGVAKDIISWFPWVKSGGTIMFDDYNDKHGVGVKAVIQETLKDHEAFIDHRIDGEMYICKKI